MSDEEMKAEPMIVTEGGRISDAAAHVPMLDNPVASKMMDELVIQEAMRDYGWTEEQARALFEGPEDIENLKKSATYKIDYDEIF